jgi:hypothetical protein
MSDAWLLTDALTLLAFKCYGSVGQFGLSAIEKLL